MTAPRIRADHDSLNQIAQAFEREADQTRALLSTLKQCQEVLAGGDWIGQGATAFYAEMNGSLLPAVQRLAAALETAGRTTKQIGQVMQAAEDEAAGVFLITQDQHAETLITNPRLGDEITANIQAGIRFLFPYDISGGMNYLKDRTAGKDLLEVAKNAKLTFKLPNGERIGYQGNDGQVSEIKFGVLQPNILGSYDSSDKSITIDDRIGRRLSTEDLASTLAHEMQHALDHRTGKILYPADDDRMNYFDLPPGKQQIIRENLANELETHIDTEIRAFERGEAIRQGRAYQDDGVMTHEERQRILGGGYEAIYEKFLSEVTPGKEFDVRLDIQGELHIDIKRPESKKEDDWWPF